MINKDRILLISLTTLMACFLTMLGFFFYLVLKYEPPIIQAEATFLWFITGLFMLLGVAVLISIIKDIPDNIKEN